MRRRINEFKPSLKERASGTELRLKLKYSGMQ
jgi:hypothetical protein